MAKFTFKLETVLILREREEQALQQELAECQRRCLQIESVIADCEAGIASERLALRDRLVAVGGSDDVRRLDVGAVRGQAAASLHLMRKLQRLAIELTGAERQREGVRARLVEATARRRAVEKLRETQYEAWKREQLRTQIAESDDLTQARLGRVRAAGDDEGEDV